ncbi:hypothetical protein ACV3VK_06215 [Clostridium perfringens]
MDNDLKIVKILKSKIKNIKFKFNYRDLKIIDENEGNFTIANMIKSNDAFMIARCGATEMRCINEYLKSGNDTKFTYKIKKEISELSGVFPNDDITLSKFCEFYISNIKNANIISLWGVGAESKVIHKYCKNSIFTKLHALEPYYFEDPWSEFLKNKKVLIVHPFTESIIRQYENREKIFDNKKILPEFKELLTVKAVQSIAGQKTNFKSWFDALEHMKKEISKRDFDIAIIGAGAYGLPLASYCKSIGKQAIQMAGATQILFGLMGKRWDDHPFISNLYNEYWTRPNLNETPKNKNKVEGGSYW